VVAVVGPGSETRTWDERAQLDVAAFAPGLGLADQQNPVLRRPVWCGLSGRIAEGPRGSGVSRRSMTWQMDAHELVSKVAIMSCRLGQGRRADLTAGSRCHEGRPQGVNGRVDMALARFMVMGSLARQDALV
jgi:hypothetical protein